MSNGLQHYGSINSDFGEYGCKQKPRTVICHLFPVTRTHACMWVYWVTMAYAGQRPERTSKRLKYIHIHINTFRIPHWTFGLACLGWHIKFIPWSTKKTLICEHSQWNGKIWYFCLWKTHRRRRLGEEALCFIFYIIKWIYKKKNKSTIVFIIVFQLCRLIWNYIIYLY